MKSKRIISLLLSLLVVVGMIPMSVFASDASSGDYYAYVRNYEELETALKNSSIEYIYIEAQYTEYDEDGNRVTKNFGWPEEEYTIDLDTDASIRLTGHWAIPENITINQYVEIEYMADTNYGHDQCSITMDGTWNRMNGYARLGSACDFILNGTMNFPNENDNPPLLVYEGGKGVFYNNGRIEVAGYGRLIVHKLVMGDGAVIAGESSYVLIRSNFINGTYYDGEISCPSGSAVIEGCVSQEIHWNNEDTTHAILSGNLFVDEIELDYDDSKIEIASGSHIKAEFIYSRCENADLTVKGTLELDNEYNSHFSQSGTLNIAEGGVMILRAGNEIGYTESGSNIAGNGTVKLYANVDENEEVMEYTKARLYGYADEYPPQVANTITIWRSWVDSTCTHNWINPVVIAPTCCLTGFTKYTCSECGIVKEADYTDATNEHSFTFEPREGYTDRMLRICTISGTPFTIRIYARDGMLVDGKPVETAWVTGLPTGVEAEIVYTDNDKPGTATASVTIGGVTIYTTFEVTGDELEAPVIKSSSVANTGKIKLTWDAVENAEKYVVYRSTSKTGTYSKMYTTSKTSYTNTNAKTGKYYYYYVVAVDANGVVSEKSNIVGRTCDLPRPTVTLSNVASSGKIKVSWTKVDGAAKYQVYRSTTKNGEYKSVKTTTSLSWTDTNTTAGKTYYYKVKAVHSNTSANSALTAYKSRTCDLPRTTVTLSNVASSGKIKVSWTKVDGAAKYQVYRATTKNGEYKSVKITTSLSWTDTNTTAGKTYYYKVKAVHSNTNANSALTAYKSRTCDLKRPTVSITTSSGKPKVSWTAVTGAKEYKIYRSTSKSGTYKVVKTTTAKYWKDTTAKKGKTYYYKVVAVHKNSSANSAYSTVVSKKCTK